MMKMKRLLSLTLVFLMLAVCAPLAFGADMETPGYAAGINGVFSSGNETGNVPGRIFDGNLSAKWAHDSIPSIVWVKTDASVTYDHVSIAFTNGHLRVYTFQLDVYTNGKWETVFSGNSSGTTQELERFDFTKPISGEWFRFTGRASNVNQWNNLSEMTGIPMEAFDQTPVLYGNEMVMGVYPVTYADGSVMLPYRKLAEAIGYQVDWNAQESSVTVSRDGRFIKARPGVAEYTDSDGGWVSEHPIKLVNGVSMLPIESTVDFLGHQMMEIKESKVYKLADRFIARDLLAALDEMEEMFDSKKQMDLYVSLYDPETGGMYFSQPAVGQECFGPNIESSAQADLPVQEYTQEEKERVGKWIQSLQDPETGWFMEPEYKIETAYVGKKQRNLFMAEAILNAVGMKPLYPTATERAAAGELEAAEETKTDITATTDDSYMSSLDAYMEFVKNTYDWDGDAPEKRTVWQAGNEIGDFAAQLKKLGWLETVSEFIRSKQRPHNGLFTDEINIDGISAVTKLSGVFTQLGIPMPYMDKIIESAAWMAENHDFYTMSEPYNVSLAIRYMVNSAGQAGIDAETQRKIDEAAPKLVRGLSKALKKFYKADGGFGYCINEPCTHSQGAYVTPPNIDCSDVNGNQLAKGVRNDLYWLLGMNTPQLYDRAEFMEALRAKKPITEPLIPLTKEQLHLEMFQ